jgi:hypothetical protein
MAPDERLSTTSPLVLLTMRLFHSLLLSRRDLANASLPRHRAASDLELDTTTLSRCRLPLASSARLASATLRSLWSGRNAFTAELQGLE